jgi:hypothetical protein
VRDVLEAHIRAGGGRFRGIRHITAWDVDSAFMNPAYPVPPHLLADPTFRDGFARLAPLNPELRCLALPSADQRTCCPGPRIPRDTDRTGPCWRSARDRRLRWPPRRGVCKLVRLHPRPRHL